MIETADISGAKNVHYTPCQMVLRKAAAAPALAPETILPRLAQLCVPDRLCKFLQQGADFQRLEFPYEQISFVRDIAESRYNIPTSINAMARVFDCPSPDTAGSILPSTKMAKDKDTPVTKGEIRDYCRIKFQSRIARGWVNSFVLHHSSEIIQTTSTAQKEQRLQMPSVFLKRTSQDLNDDVQVCIAELFFNLDEVGISDWDDRKQTKSPSQRPWIARRSIREYLEM
jgi:hypothetical protein